jgi:hypothetical protein
VDKKREKKVRSLEVAGGRSDEVGDVRQKKRERRV